LEEAEYLCNGIGIIDHGRIVERTVVKELITQLPSETLILDLEEPVVSDALPTCECVEMKLQDPTTLEVTFPKALTINNIFEKLTDHGIKVVSMRNKSNRLEELFLARVGSKSSES